MIARGRTAAAICLALASSVAVLGAVAALDFATENYTGGLEFALVSAALLFVREIVVDGQTPPVPLADVLLSRDESFTARLFNPVTGPDVRLSPVGCAPTSSVKASPSIPTPMSVGPPPELHPSTLRSENLSQCRAIAILAGLTVALLILGAVAVVYLWTRRSVKKDHAWKER